MQVVIINSHNTAVIKVHINSLILLKKCLFGTSSRYIKKLHFIIHSIFDYKCRWLVVVLQINLDEGIVLVFDSKTRPTRCSKRASPILVQ